MGILSVKTDANHFLVMAKFSPLFFTQYDISTAVVLKQSKAIMYALIFFKQSYVGFTKPSIKFQMAQGRIPNQNLENITGSKMMKLQNLLISTISD